MGLNKQAVTFFSFTGGLNTESSPLNTPAEDAQVLDNVRLNSDGSIERRPALDFLGTEWVNYPDDTIDRSEFFALAPTIYPFSMVLSDGSIQNFLVSSVGRYLYFYADTRTTTLAQAGTPLQTVTLPAPAARYKGSFVLTGNVLYFLCGGADIQRITYDEVLGQFNVDPILIRTRQLQADAPITQYVNHNGKNYQCIQTHLGQTTPLQTIRYYYNTTGSSWVEQSTEVIAGSRAEPGVSTDWEDYWVLLGTTDDNYGPWVAGTKYNSNVISVNELLYSGSLDQTVYNFARPDIVALSGGRLFITGAPQQPNTIWYSQSLSESKRHVAAFPIADPYNKFDNAPVDTDGGSIVIREAAQILALQPFAEGVLILCTNGVWHLTGAGGSFKPTDFLLRKVSDEGIVSRNAVTAVENFVVYGGANGVYAISDATVSGEAQAQELSVKINSFYNDIPGYAKSGMKMVYNDTRQVLVAAYPDGPEDWVTQYTRFRQPTWFRKFLLFDVKLKAWYTYSLSSDATGVKAAVGDISFVSLTGGAQIIDSVVTELGDTVTDEVGNPVITVTDSTPLLIGELLCMILKRSGDSQQWAFADFDQGASEDFSKIPAESESYDSLVITAMQVLNDISHKKQVPYILTVFERTETGEYDGETPIGDGGCLMAVAWDFASTDAAAKFGVYRQVYLPHRWGTSYMDGRFPGYGVVITKNKIRGRGRSFQIRFKNDGSKPFRLYGFQVEFTASRSV